MKSILISTGILLCTLTSFSQEFIKLPYDKAEEVTWENDEKQYYSNVWQTEVVTNVSAPTMRVFKADEAKNTGVAVIVAPGGGLYGLSINSEGNDVGQWLAERGITTFVLRYRLVPTGEDGAAEIMKLGNENPQQLMKNVAEVIPYSIQDGLNAISHVRENATSYGINPNKIGFMGFSAGGAVAMGVAYNYDEKTRPDFLVPVYYWYDAMPVQPAKDDAPPAFIICATDDPLGLARGSVALYNSFLEKGKPVALQMYSKGGHGFGMKDQGLPSDTWIERFHEWAMAQGIVNP
ncbi:alpha/beta hydrolase [Allomuricauda sp. d1]|uniref:alpha/beta hydrolase n=1 Tax=Allomuricauda sp. d1 TaxID=3136725 RepID=UPI0031D7AE80